MNKNLYLLLLIFISNLINAQTKFEKGFYIDNNNVQQNGLIKNSDWANNPNKFEFKKEENSDVEIISIDYAKEFEISNISRYVRADVAIERSSNKLDYIGSRKDPNYSTEKLFLKELVSGSSKLFKYEENGLEKFFFSVDNSPITQLIYIKYKANETDVTNDPNITLGDVLVNDLYKRQLWTSVRNETITQAKIKNTNYNTSDLANYFNAYNDSRGDKKNDRVASKKVIFNFKASGIVNQSSMNVDLYSPSYSPKFKNTNFGGGIEIELFLPFNNNKWSVIVEPSYNTFKDKQTLPPPSPGAEPNTSEVDITYIQIPLGIRHHFFLTDNSKLFVNALGCVRLFGEKNKINYSDDIDDNHPGLPFSPSRFSLALGLGYNYKKISSEIRYFVGTNISELTNVRIQFSTASLILRYEVFSNKK
jgi:outer membrane protein with beta-barrel domain